MHEQLLKHVNDNLDLIQELKAGIATLTACVQVMRGEEAGLEFQNELITLLNKFSANISVREDIEPYDDDDYDFKNNNLIENQAEEPKPPTLYEKIVSWVDDSTDENETRIDGLFITKLPNTGLYIEIIDPEIDDEGECSRIYRYDELKETVIARRLFLSGGKRNDE